MCEQALVRDFVFPNGLAFSPDEKIIYISDFRRGHIRAFDVLRNGTLGIATDRVFCELQGEGPGAPDGMKVDVEGNVYCTGLGTILTGAQTTNIGWGGEDWKTLFFTTRHTLGRIELKVPGIPVPAKPLG